MSSAHHSSACSCFHRFGAWLPALPLARDTTPQPVLDAVGLMGGAVVPIMIFTVGLALDFRDVKRLAIAVPALAIKLILAPALAWWIGSRLG